MLYMKYRATKPRGRAWQMERNLLKPMVLRWWRRSVKEIGAAAWLEHRRARRREPTRTGRPPCDLTLNLELARAKQMFGWAVRERLIDRHPLVDAKPVKTHTRRGSWFTAD